MRSETVAKNVFTKICLYTWVYLNILESTNDWNKHHLDKWKCTALKCYFIRLKFGIQITIAIIIIIIINHYYSCCCYYYFHFNYYYYYCYYYHYYYYYYYYYYFKPLFQVIITQLRPIITTVKENQIYSTYPMLIFQTSFRRTLSPFSSFYH